MILDHDAIKEKYIKDGYSFGEACGLSTHDMIEAIRNHTGTIIAVYGPPGIGKSEFIKRHLSRFFIVGDSLIIETSGLNLGLNAALKVRRDRDPWDNRRFDRTIFVRLGGPKSLCLKRIQERAERPLDKENGRDRLAATVGRWFDTYTQCKIEDGVVTNCPLPCDALIHNNGTDNGWRRIF